ncbi:hypothetical protein N7492_004566 [Penicillium capsulatum]|uniref:Uncharacterized protein n=1 Tax=Penicillium capsulatum TaxID=69766 RepID=A0A9W9IA62_9EURO|nr:hypothetical protein N7492_004566 [Penicillium capsulatum]KAJ6136316.1 hypothetical protein N7512_001476 [Penicillium capsulatum]
MPFEEDYFKELEKGTSFQRWIDDPSAKRCPVQKAELAIQDLDLQYWVVNRAVGSVPDGYSTDRMRLLDLPTRQYRAVELKRYGVTVEDMAWIGRVARGVIFVEEVHREEDIIGPYTSELAIAAYRETYDLATLKHIFVINVQNTVMRALIIRLCCPTSVKVVEHGTREYRALLGTPIGKMVAAIVLGAFERGTFRIARISIWWNGPRHSSAQAQFDLEPIES